MQAQKLPGGAGPSLPTTIEGATQRYLITYEDNFRGPVAERCRLKDLAEAKIHALRKKAPSFFENKLPQIVNQAGSSLLNHDTSTDAGNKAFNVTHSDFLRVLDELKKSQPAGDTSFQSERDRHILKEDLQKQHLKIRDRIADLEAQELDVEELGCDGDTDSDLGAEEVAALREAASRREESRYQKIFVELDELKHKLRQVATRIAFMEGESLEDEVEFELKVAPRTMLERLDKNQLKKLEAQICQFLAEKKSRREFPQKAVVERWLALAGVSQITFKQQEFNDLTKDTSDAIRTFFRERENERRNEYFESLINNKKLLPKEGIILSSPDDIPDSVRVQLELSEKRSKRKLDEYCEQYSKMVCEEDKGCDDLEADQSEDEVDNDLRRELVTFKRVKEEPRDDCEPDNGSGDEVILEEGIANDIESTLGHNRNNTTAIAGAQQVQILNSNSQEKNKESDISDYDDAIEGPSNGYDPYDPYNIYKTPNPQQLSKNLNSLLDEQLNAPLYHMNDEEEEEDDDDELECLGVVEPKDKCPTIDLTEK